MASRYLFIFILLATPATLSAENENRVRLSGSHVLSVLALVALEQGYFEKRDLDVEFQRIRVGKLNMDAVLNGSVDYAIVVDSNLAFNSFSNSPLRAIAALMRTAIDGFAVQAARAIKSPADLRNKRIGYLPATTSHLFLLSELHAHGISFSEIRPYALQPPSMHPALRVGIVDAVSIWHPWRYQITESLDVLDLPNDTAEYYPRAYLAATKETLKMRPQTTVLLLEALLEAEQYIEANRDAVKTRYGEWNEFYGTALEHVWQNSRIQISLSREDMEVVAKDIELIRKADPSFKTPRPLKEIFATEPLRSAAPHRLASE